MKLEGKRVGFVLTGSFCTFHLVKEQMKNVLKEGAEVLPIMSDHSYELDTKFGKAKEHIEEIEKMTDRNIIHTIQEAEPIGPKNLTDILIIAPCSGNTIAKLANGIVDNAATMATKSHLRNGNPVVLAISTNDGLSGSAENIGKLLNRNNYFFVPFRQDNPITKPRSLVFDSNLIVKTLESALDKEQIQPILL